MSRIPPPAIPPMLSYATPAPRNDLRVIATRQRAIMALGAVITGAVFVFMLSLAIYSTAVGILLGILTLIPLLGLLVLLMVNGKATTLLRQHGIRVGLMGADPSQIPAP